MKISAIAALGLGALIILSAGCSDAVRPEPPVLEPPSSPPAAPPSPPSMGPPGELVFSRQGQIYRVRLDGSGLTRLTTSGNNWHPVWSPDGKRIAFARNKRGPSNNGFGETDIYIMDADGYNLVQRTNTGNFHYAAWSPDGRKLAITDDRIYESDIYVISVDNDGSGPIHLASDAASPAWSPDGKQIVFVRISGDDGYHHLAVIDVDGTGARPLTEIDPAGIYGLTWSPGGERIAFSKCAGACDVYTMQPDGSRITQITRLANATHTAWSPDGEWIAFTANDYAGVEWRPSIAYVPVEGGTPTVVSDGAHPSWRP